MAKTTWHYLPGEIPDQDAEVWVRRSELSPPWRAVFDGVGMTFTAGNGMICPWYAVTAWREI